MVTEAACRQRVYVASGLNVLAGVWLIAAPFVLEFAGVQVAVWNSVFAGMLVAALAILRVSQPARREGVSWANCALGVWLVFSPIVLGYWGILPAVWNHMIIGVVIIALAAISASATHIMQRRLLHA